MEINKDFIAAVKLHDTPQWRLAQGAGLAPSTLTHYLQGYRPPSEVGVSALEKIALAIGFPPDQIFKPQGR